MKATLIVALLYVCLFAIYPLKVEAQTKLDALQEAPPPRLLHLQA